MRGMEWVTKFIFIRMVLKPRSDDGSGARTTNVRPASIASILRHSPADDDGEGPYFDLEFCIPEENDEVDFAAATGSSSDDDDVVSGGGLRSDPDDDIFFKGRSSLLFTPSSKPHFPSSLLKSATKFRVFMLRFKKSPKSPKHPHLEAPESSPKKQKQNKFSVKLKIEEVHIGSLFTRDGGASRSSSARSAKLHAEEAMHSPAAACHDEKKNPKFAIRKYLDKIKPLHILARTRSSGQPAAGEQEKGAHSGGLRIVSKRLRKSRSAAAAVRSPPRRRDDSLLMQEDGIQSAIAHCKRSFNAGDGLALARSRSDPGAERCD